MAWQPIRPRQTGPSPFMRAVISRCTLGVVALALAFGSYKCIDASLEFAAEARAREGNQTTTGRRLSGSALPMAIGVGLGLLGIIAGAGAVLPSSFFERFVRPPGDAEEDAEKIKSFFRWPF